MAVTEAALINAGVQAGLIESETLSKLKLDARRERIPLLEIVMRKGRFPEAALYQALADLRNMPFFLSKDLKPDTSLMQKLPQVILQRRPMVPVLRNEEFYLAISDPDDKVSLDTAQRSCNIRFKAALSPPEALASALRRWNKLHHPGVEFESNTGEVDAIGLLDDIMKDAYLRRATDIHIEPEKYEMRVRMRVDGYLQEFYRPLNTSEGEAVVTRIKVLTQMDIAEQRIAQDGGMSYEMQQWSVDPFDIRAASIPTRWGERVAMRLLGQGTRGFSLEQLGMPASIFASFSEAINQPHGIILVTGPTGSGKSTTLYAALKELDADELNILTVEDPIEQTIDNISQVQVSSKVNFAKALRSFLRHDPDVILVGEIRDIETAETALKAAMTGHLVFSTLHTNDAVSAVTRLVDIGVAHYLIGATLSGVIAQRLVRRLCPHCKEAYEPSGQERKKLNWNKEEGKDNRIYKPKGCPACLGTGFLGRIGLYEALWIDRDLAELISDGAREEQLRKAAGDNYLTLWQDGRDKIFQGETSYSEVSHFVMYQ